MHPCGIEGWLVFSLCPFPDESADVNQSWCHTVQPFDSFPWLLNVWPPKVPLVSLRAICLACIYSQINLQMCTKFDANRTSRLTYSPDFWICDPPNPPPPMSRGELHLAYVHSQTNPQTCTKFRANRSSRLTASQDFWIGDPLKPPEMPPCVLRFNWFGIYPFPDDSAHVCQIWCKSVQPFGSFSWVWATLVRLLATGCAVSRAKKKTRQKQHVYIENYNSGPNMQTSTSLTFFTAIFIALGGALAEELMLWCRHVRTELYI